MEKKKKELNTSLSRPAATVMMPPVLLLIVNILGDGLSGFWDKILYRRMPFADLGSSLSIDVTVITNVPLRQKKKKNIYSMWPSNVLIVNESPVFIFQTLKYQMNNSCSANTAATLELEAHAWGKKKKKTCKSLTWFGALWNSSVPDLVSELWSVVIHVNYVDHNIYGVFHLVAIQVYCMSSQLKENKKNMWIVEWFKQAF